MIVIRVALHCTRSVGHYATYYTLRTRNTEVFMICPSRQLASVTIMRHAAFF